MRLKKYTLEELKIAIQESCSYRQALSKLNVKEQGGNYIVIKKAIKFYNLDISHFTGQCWNKGKKTGSKRSLSDYLNNLYPIDSHKLRLRLLKDKIFEHKCYQCELTYWNNKLIPLELEHIDGNHSNNKLDNLTLLCPNCHAQTSTYRGRNKKS